MLAMVGDPLDERALHGHAAEDRERRLHRRPRLEALVREVPVEADRRPERAHDIENGEDDDVEPVEGDSPERSRCDGNRERRDDDGDERHHLTDRARARTDGSDLRAHAASAQVEIRSAASEAQRRARGSGTTPRPARTAMPWTAPGMTPYVPSTPSDRARSNPRRELAALTPGTPGSARSNCPCRTSSRRPRNRERSSRSGSHGARPSTPSTPGASALPPATAPPMEKPTITVRSAPPAAIAARVSSSPQSSRRHDFTRYRTSAKTMAGKRGATCATSHSSVALHVPGASPAWPPFTQTTPSASVAPVMRISAPVGSGIIQPAMRS